MSRFAQMLREAGTEYAENTALAPLSSFRTGGCAAFTVHPSDREQLAASLWAARACKIKYEIIGNASNVLFPDGKYDGAIIFTKGLNTLRIEGESLYCDAGVSLNAATLTAAQAGLSGLEFAYGIPGTVGGAVFMNAGAYGGSTSDVLESTEALDITDRRFFTLTVKEINFGYRRSAFSESEKLVCIGATFLLTRGESGKINTQMRENMAKRREKQPLKFPSAGSFFKRPEGNFAGKLIEDCGLKGAKIGGAMVSEKHAGFIINTGKATSDDIKTLAEYVRHTVLEKTGISLENEVRYIV